MAEESDERTIELTIEALTGTVYDLCVSPYETILGIKLKVQRLEGIPVYQQQLVWGGLELQDEFCLEEYSIPSGAQLKLLIAMRGGPIHAQRVHLDLEDPALLEIAELLDSQAGEKYTLMLLRNGDDLDHASFVQVQMLEEDDAMRLSPIHVTEPQHLSMTSNKATCTDHAITRDKMKELMAKFKKERQFRQAPSPPQTTSAQLSRKSAGKVLILESRAPSRLLHNSSSRVTSAHANEARLAQRKLVFPPTETCPHLHGQPKPKKRMASSLASRRLRSPSEATPIKTCSRMQVSEEYDNGAESSVFERERSCPFAESAGVESSHKRVTKTELGGKTWHKPSKRKRRVANTIEPTAPSLSTITADISRKLSQLDLNSSLPPIDQTQLSWSNNRTDFLPPLVCPHPPPAPPTSSTHSKSLVQPLPSLSVAPSNGVTRKRRCMKCGKKMGLASTYSCRCGGLFCAVHRYAETHSCTFDYKTEGRQIIARSNPVVAAQKLPKI